jgi:N-acetylglucosaminyldiphosphoundecaprenol N-acetyl-beta-D-mannosaminyltransferase
MDVMDSTLHLPIPVPRMPSRVNVLGVGVNGVDIYDALRQSDCLIRSKGTGYICVSDVHSVMEGFRDPELRKILNSSFMTAPDGMPLVWIGRLRGRQDMSRVYGPDFLLAMCRLSIARKYRNFFYGGGPGIAERLSTRLKERFPGLDVVGIYTPPFRPLSDGEEQELARLVSATKPDIFWVGLGSPKQERFMARYCGRLSCNLMVGVGAAFDFHSGAIKEAPRWLHKTGLQWLYRLTQEPRRLWQRYLTCVPSFLWNSTLQMAGFRRFKLDVT